MLLDKRNVFNQGGLYRGWQVRALSAAAGVMKAKHCIIFHHLHVRPFGRPARNIPPVMLTWKKLREEGALQEHVSSSTQQEPVQQGRELQPLLTLHCHTGVLASLASKPELATDDVSTACWSNIWCESPPAPWVCRAESRYLYSTGSLDFNRERI